MPGGTSKARVHRRFYDQCQALSQQAAAQAEAVTDGKGRPWQIGDPGSWEGDPNDVVGMTAAFDRSEIGSNFAELYDLSATPGTTGDANGLRLQNDYLAAMERAFRTSRASLPRTEMFAAGRRRGHGKESGALVGGVIRYVQDLITAGQQ